ncbi:hypothetical protein [Microvirga alba]|uniref:YcxB-like protein domain-containing protein n=1 Tax=Microvirga alba TaxID=2791025 RepID=A0A931BLH6_9HYPH|nr:hypothetical protein [Microvirga alba]MBF9233446.1 hypothetical protein [Microvirga alba]
MSVDTLEAEVAQTFEAMEKVLGQVSWRLHIPKADHKTDVAAQDVFFSHMRRRMRHFMLPFKLVSWGILFAVAFYVMSHLSFDSMGARLFSILALMAAAFLPLTIHRVALHRAMHGDKRSLATDLMLGEGGILMFGGSWAQLCSWADIIAFEEGEYSFNLLTNYFVVIAIPSAVLSKHPDAQAIMAFIEQKTSGIDKA